MPPIIPSPSSLVPKTGTDNFYSGKPITDFIVNGFFTVDHKWTVRSWNRAAEILLGVQEKDIIGKNLWEQFAETIPLNFYMVYHKAFLKDIPVYFEEYWAERGAWFEVITYYSRNILSVSFKSSKQASHQTEPEHQLKILNDLYRFVTEVTSDCLWEWNLRNGEMFWIDGGHRRVFGYHIVNTLIPQSFWESLLHPDDAKRLLTKLHHIINEGPGPVWEEEYRFKRTDGSYAFVHDRAHIVYDEDHRASRMIGATQDISARKVTELQLLESEQKLALIARQTINAVIITDPEEKITWVNKAFTRITGYGSAEVMGKKPGSFLQGKETNPLTINYLRQKMKARLPFDCEIVNYAKSGRKYWIRIQGQPILDEKGNCEHFFAIETDITEKILLENKLENERQTWHKDMNDAVLTAQENERAKIGRELHDNLNQVLGATKLYIEMAKTDEGSRELYLDKACTYIMNVIDEIRQISKTLVTPAVRLMGLSDSINVLIDDLTIVDPIKIEFQDNDLNEEELDEKLQLNIYRIVQEQFNNILKHAKATRVKINLRKQGDEIMLIISDNGVGCDLLTVKKGLGLMNVRTRAELYFGMVTVISKPGEGYVLKVLLHLNAPEE
jgi:PAS domain S-box-containing protein